MKTAAASSTAKYVSLVVASIVTLLPLGLILFGSLKTNQEFLSTNPFQPPDGLVQRRQLRARVHSRADGPGVLQHRAHLRLAAIIGTILIGAATAYALDRFSFRDAASSSSDACWRPSSRA